MSGTGERSAVFLAVMELAVPLLSFGGTATGVLVWDLGLLRDFQYAAGGCILGSVMLAYLAWIRPRKDIVALSTPVYAVVFFLAPTDFLPGLTLQLLFSAGLTVLLIRLKYRFGDPDTGVDEGSFLAEPLSTYVGRTGTSFTGLVPEAGHRAAVTFVRFAEGEYRVAADMARDAGSHGEYPAPLLRAFGILREHAELLDKNLPSPATYLTFLPVDSPLLARSLAPSAGRDTAVDTTLDNALLMVYSAAWEASVADRPHLLACQKFAKKLLVS